MSNRSKSMSALCCRQTNCKDDIEEGDETVKENSKSRRQNAFRQGRLIETGFGRIVGTDASDYRGNAKRSDTALLRILLLLSVCSMN